MTSTEANRSDQTPAGPNGHGGGPGRLLAIPVIVGILLALFAWPQANLEPRGLPVGLAGPDAATARIEAEIARTPDAMNIHRFADAAEARDAVEDREVYGAFVASPEGVELLTASAASPAVSAALTEVASGGEAGGFEASEEAPAITVTDVVPADPDDPRGAAFASGVLPLLIAGIITGFLCANTFRPGAHQIGALIGASALAGLAAVAVTQGWLEMLEGSWLANAAVLSLMVLAVAALVAGCIALLGMPGIALAAVIVVLLGNPWSGIATAPELLPTPAATSASSCPPAPGGTRCEAPRSSTGPALAVPCWCWSPGLRSALAGSFSARERSPRASRSVASWA